MQNQSQSMCTTWTWPRALRAAGAAASRVTTCVVAAVTIASTTAPDASARSRAPASSGGCTTRRHPARTGKRTAARACEASRAASSWPSAKKAAWALRSTSRVYPSWSSSGVKASGCAKNRWKNLNGRTTTTSAACGPRYQTSKRSSTTRAMRAPPGKSRESSFWCVRSGQSSRETILPWKRIDSNSRSRTSATASAYSRDPAV
mmetsp:Transcript_6458/g.23013  ORF Transcript_6458/g.23013 Transcript_6458/m.23013 type:complete len:204 (-) Transcript_6458:444-1055(-)